jgi:hypothetical protein
MSALIVLIFGLGGPGIMPALAVARRSPVLFFLAPLIGAAMAAVAATLELGVGGTLPEWYLAVAATVNVAVIVWWFAAGQHRPGAGPPWGWWPVVSLVVVLGALAIPLSALRTPLIGWDGNTIWLTKALLLSGGHHVLLAGLQNPVYQPSNPDYPMLAPAAGALAFAIFGRGDLHLATDMTVLLNACALGVAGTGIAAAGNGGRRLTRVAAAAAAGATCLAGFAVAGSYGLNGYMDPLWSSAAVAAIVWGLVLPRSTESLIIAWICAVVASLTKNEGLTTALIVLVLIALRYRPLTLAELRQLRTRLGRLRGSPGPDARQVARSWAGRAVFVIVPALPGLAWAALAYIDGLRDNFFLPTSTESLAYRAGATAVGMAGHLVVAPIALAVLIAGCLMLRGVRERGRLANPAWLWTACLFSLGIIFATYVLGGFEIHLWLRFSVDRTTIFAQLLLLADLAIWLVIAVDAASSREGSEQRDAAPSAVSAAGGTTDGGRESGQLVR